MTFSSRVPASLEAGPWARRLARLRKSGHPLLDLTDHNPTTAALGYLDAPDALAALAEPGARQSVPDARGRAPARAAIARYYADHGATMPPERVLLTASTSESYAHAFRLLCDAGDAVLVPTPSYPLFDPLAQAECVRTLPYPLRFAGDVWRLDTDALARIVEGTAAGDARIRALVAVHPNHPTGSRLTRSEAAFLRTLCARADIALIVDEVFLDYRNAGGRPAGELAGTFAGGPGDGDGPEEDGPLTLVFSGLSKVCGLPQVKLGWIAVSGPGALVDPALTRLEWLTDAFLSVNEPVQHALPLLLSARAAFQDAVRARVAAARTTLTDALRAIPGARMLPADGGWSAVLALPPVRSDEEWALALLEHDVVVHPGYFYDIAEPAHLVVSLLPPPGVFEEAVFRLIRVAE